jgi:adenosyl cobinamide kinase/adenosyl cobinamide phosphate guanylyltransferase
VGAITFLTGPARSGKSAKAVEIASQWGEDVVFVATWAAEPGDPEMDERVTRHRRERPAAWRTLEAPEDIASALCALSPPPRGAILDSIVLWASARFDWRDDEILAAWSGILAVLNAALFPVVIVGDEVGWGTVPMEAGLRRFRDLNGWLNQRTAAAAREAWLMVAGCPVRLK